MGKLTHLQRRMDFRRLIGNECKPRPRGVGLLLVKIKEELSAMKSLICCLAILILAQGWSLYAAGLLYGLVFYWDSIQKLESFLDA